MKGDYMKTLVVFYSLGGYTKYISEILAKELEADTLELKTKKVYPPTGLKRFICGGKSVVFKEQPELTNDNIDLSSY
jgi:flavodoxin